MCSRECASLNQTRVYGVNKFSLAAMQPSIHRGTGGNMLIRVLLNLFTAILCDIDKITRNLNRSTSSSRTSNFLSPTNEGPHSICMMHRYALVATITHDIIMTNRCHISRGECITAILHSLYIRLLCRNEVVEKKTNLSNMKLKSLIILYYW